MRKKSAKKKSRDILDSDDELPTEYIDLPIVPAYQLDYRFECFEVKKEDEALKQRKREVKRLKNDRHVVTLGYLNKKDTFCFQCLEPTSGKKTQQWFFNFLILKDLHSSFTFLTTCLVPSYENDYYIANRKLEI